VDPYEELLQRSRGSFATGPTAIPGPAGGGTRFRVPQGTDELLDALRNLPNKAREQVLAPGGLLKNLAGDYRRAAGGKSAAALSALGTFTQDPVAGLVSAPVGIAAGAGANVLTTALTQGMMQGPPPLKAAGMALRYLAPAMVGSSVQQATAKGVQNITGTASQTASDVAQSAGGGLFGIGTALQDLSIPVPFLGNIAIGERAKRSREAEYQRGERAKDVKSELELLKQQSAFELQNQIAGQRALAEISTNAYLNQVKAMQPILADAQRRELAGQQALLNTQGAIYQKLGRMSGMFQLADRSMAETGALARTMAANSPYQAAILPAPQISFGR